MSELREGRHPLQCRVSCRITTALRMFKEVVDGKADGTRRHVAVVGANDANNRAGRSRKALVLRRILPSGSPASTT